MPDFFKGSCHLKTQRTIYVSHQNGFVKCLQHEDKSSHKSLFIIKRVFLSHCLRNQIDIYMYMLTLDGSKPLPFRDLLFNCTQSLHSG